MKKDDIDVIFLTGNYKERAKQEADAYIHEIPLLAKKTNATFRDIISSIPSANLKPVSRFLLGLPLIGTMHARKMLIEESAAKAYLARPELQETARETHTSSYDLARYNSLADSLMYTLDLPACTTIGIAKNRTKSHQTILARNLDFFGQGIMDKNAVVKIVRPENGIPYMALGDLPGHIGVGHTGMNELGVSLCANYIIGESTKKINGEPLPLVLERVLSSAKNAEEAADIIKKSNLINHWQIIVADKSRVLAIEKNNKQQDNIENNFTNGGLIVTNHSLNYPPVKKTPYLAETIKASEHRRKTAEEMLPEHNITGEDLLKILGSNYEHSSDKYPNPAKAYSIGNQFNVVSAIMIPEEKAAWIFTGSPAAHSKGYYVNFTGRVREKDTPALLQRQIDKIDSQKPPNKSLEEKVALTLTLAILTSFLLISFKFTGNAIFETNNILIKSSMLILTTYLLIPLAILYFSIFRKLKKKQRKPF